MPTADVSKLFHQRQTDEQGQPFEITDHLDVRGMNCSKAASFALTASLSLRPGGVLEVLGNKMCAKMEVPGAVCSKSFLSVFHIIQENDADDSLWWIYIRRT